MFSFSHILNSIHKVISKKKRPSIAKKRPRRTATLAIESLEERHLPAGSLAASQLAVFQPSTITAGNAFSVTVAVEDSLGNIDTAFKGNVTLSLGNNPGGSTLSGTLSATAVNGVATFSNLSLNNAGIGYTLQSSASNTSIIAGTSNMFAVSPFAGNGVGAAPYTQQITAPVSSTDSAGRALTYTTQIGNYSLLFAVKQQLGLAAPSATLNLLYNSRGASEKYLVSTNGSNAAGGGYYVILPNGNLYAWVSNSLAKTLAAAPVAQLGASAYNAPTLLLNAAPSYNPIVYNLQQKLKLQAPAGSAIYFYNTRLAQEKYLVSGNGSNPAGAGYYVLMPNGNLYAWTNGSLAGVLTTAPVATLPAYYYQNPAYLTAATPPSGSLGISATLAGGALTVKDVSFVGPAMVYVTASTGSSSTVESILVEFTDTAPTVTQPANQTLPSSQQATTTLTGTAAFGKTPTYSAKVGGYNTLFAADQQFALAAPPGTTNYFYNSRGGHEKYVISTNGSNPLGAGYYIIMPNGNLYAWDRVSLASSLAAPAAASPGVKAYADPNQLIYAQPPHIPLAYSTEQSLKLQAPTGDGTYFYNSRGLQEKYLISTNGSNSAAAGYYIILPNGNLYAFDGNISSTVSVAPVATLPVIYYQNPGLLIYATPPGPLSSVSAKITGNTLAVTSSGFQGTATVYITASDGLLSTTQTFLITYTGVPIVASAGANQSMKEGSPITFAGTASGGVGALNYSWDFGDGSTTSGSSTPTHTYTLFGTYTPTLTVTDNFGNSVQSSATVTVTDIAPTVSMGGPYTGAANALISFAGSGSQPSSAETATLTYAWNFGDGATSSLKNPTHAYASAGSFPVSLTVKNANGLSSSASTTATVSAVSQTINFTAPASPITFAPAQTVKLSATASSGLPVSFSIDPSSTGKGTINGSTLTITGVGSIVIDANQAGNNSYSAAGQVQKTLVINRAGQAITFTAPASPISFVSGQQLTLNATTNSGLPVSFSIDPSSTGKGTVSGNILTVTGAGNIVIDANQAGDSNYSSAIQVQKILVVNPGTTGTQGTPTEPLLYQSNLQYVGAFRVPNTQPDGASTNFGYAGGVLAYNAAHNSLFIAGLYGDITELSIPSSIVNSTDLNSLATASILQTQTPVLPSLNNPSNATVIGGLTVANGKLIGTAYVYYDNSSTTVLSHFVLSSLNLSTASIGGLYQVGNLGAGLVAGYMAPIPSEWQSALGSPYLTGLADVPIISRSSSGPAAFGFNPANLGSGVTPATPYSYYGITNRLGPYEDYVDPLQNSTSAVNGAVFAPGSSSVLFFGTTGAGFIGYGENTNWSDNSGSKGPHSLNGQYSFQVWAYNANDFVAVKNGTMQHDQVQPYDVWNFSLPIVGSGGGLYDIGGVTFDPATNRVYVSVINADDAVPYSYLPLIEVFQLSTTSTSGPQAPQVGSLTGTPQTTPSGTDTAFPQYFGTYTGPVHRGDPVILSAGNVFALNPGASISQVAFYVTPIGGSTFSMTVDTLLGKGVPGSSSLLTYGSHNYQLTMSTSGLAAGKYTVFAQALDSNGLYSAPVSWTLTIV